MRVGTPTPAVCRGNIQTGLASLVTGSGAMTPSGGTPKGSDARFAPTWWKIRVLPQASRLLSSAFNRQALSLTGDLAMIGRGRSTAISAGALGRALERRLSFFLEGGKALPDVGMIEQRGEGFGLDSLARR